MRRAAGIKGMVGRVDTRSLRRTAAGLLGAGAALLWIGAAAAQDRSPDPFSGEMGLPESIRAALGQAATPAATTAIEPPAAVPLLEGPVDPATYRLGPGDELTVHYRGKTSVVHRLLIAPEGSAYLPDVGVVMLAGKTLEAGRAAVRSAAARILRDVAVDVQLTGLRTFKVSVGGEVRRPGVYAATAVTRVSELINAAGGIRDSAAVRDVRLIEADGRSTSVDLLPFVLAGQVKDFNPRVVDGQGLFVPRRTRAVVVRGAVVHPGLYDLPPAGTTVGALLDVVGLQPAAATDSIEVLARGAAGGPAPAGQQVDGLAGLSSRLLDDGDQVLVRFRQYPARGDVATISGEVARPGPFAITAGRTSVRDLIGLSGGGTTWAGLGRVRLVRAVDVDSTSRSLQPLERFPNVTLTATEREILRSRGIERYRAVVVDLSAPEASGPMLAPGDEVIVPRRLDYVEVGGRVRSPGFYPWSAEASARDYVDLAGGFADKADRGNVRVSAGPGDNLPRADDAGPIQPGDRVWVPERIPRPSWDTVRDIVMIVGQAATLILVIHQLGK